MFTVAAVAMPAHAEDMTIRVTASQWWWNVRYENDEDFKQGRNFQIVELNGATSEATSIYDSRNSLFSAYRTLFRQWRLVFAIGAINRAKGHAPSSLAMLWRNWRQYSAAALSYPLAD